jgi:hypothetical protein
MLKINASFNNVYKYSLINVLNNSKRAIIKKNKLAFKVFSNILKQSIVLRFINKYINKSL